MNTEIINKNIDYLITNYSRLHNDKHYVIKNKLTLIGIYSREPLIFTLPAKYFLRSDKDPNIHPWVDLIKTIETYKQSPNKFYNCIDIKETTDVNAVDRTLVYNDVPYMQRSAYIKKIGKPDKGKELLLVNEYSNVLEFTAPKLYVKIT